MSASPPSDTRTIAGAVVVAVHHGAVRSRVAAESARLGAADAVRVREARGADERLRLLAGRAALRRAAAMLTGEPEDAFVIAAPCPDCGRSHGRPQLEGRSGVHLSLTHAGGRAIAAAARVPVGIDAEPWATDAERLRAITAVAGATASPLRHWTRVEATLKADGRGLRVDPASVRIGLRGRARLDGRRYRLHDAALDEAVCVSVALEQPRSGVRGERGERQPLQPGVEQPVEGFG